MAGRSYLGGHLTNAPPTSPDGFRTQGVDPKNAMPDLGVADQEAKDIAAFLLHAAQTMDELPAKVPG